MEREREGEEGREWEREGGRELEGERGRRRRRMGGRGVEEIKRTGDGVGRRKGG